ncbi:hypothetical protein J1N10_03795 [Carboxylicivirga sp. A043]|uniref:hypothetical protein n=1 Tax=Carboxylicivirga litoralis TaxID=2816963 RepID=UPI0021CB6823|nr:hypothetical protein [Carboxylicivirga sp. A043]MCU4155083.1 hypothetical protein [Carboxylicivirga sp. A043]
MEEDIYKQLLAKARRDKPRLRDVQSFKTKVLNEIDTERSRGGLLQFIRVAASIVLLFSLGAYVWMEVYTWENRLAIEQRTTPVSMIHKSDWQCRKAVNELMASLFETSALVRHNDGVYINKGSIELLEFENSELFIVMQTVLGHIEQYSPSDFKVYQSGEDIRLNAWQLRHEYSVCEMLTK